MLRISAELLLPLLAEGEDSLGCHDFRSFRPIALGRTQNSFERKEWFVFVHKQLLTVVEPPKVGRERKWADFGGCAQG